MKKSKILLGLGALCLTTFAAVSCGGNKPTPPTPGPGPVIPDKPDPDKPTEDDKVVKSFEVITTSSDNIFYVTKKGSSYIGEEGSVSIVNILPTTATADFTYKSSDPSVIKISRVNGSFKTLKPGKADITVSTKEKGNQPEVSVTIKCEVKESLEATGGYNFQALKYEDKGEIIGKLEGWAMNNHLTGITLFQNGGYILYNPRLTLGSEEYIPGFGYGNLSNGIITDEAPLLDSDTTPEYKKYYHEVLSSNPPNINYLNSQGQVIGELFGYISAGLWNTKMNATKDGYEWYPCLAKGELDPINEDEATGLATKFRVDVKTGAKDGLVYRTMGKRSEFDKRPVVVEDYINAYKQLLTKGNKLSRGAELTSMTSDGTLKGANAYYNLSAGGVNDELFDKLVGIHKVDDDTLEFELAKPTTAFYAKYSLASSLTQPLPEDFVDAIGGMTFYGSKNQNDKSINGGAGVEDNILCLGPYLLEKFDNKNTGGRVIFKRNDDFIDRKNKDEGIRNRYTIPGIYASIREGVSEQEMLKFFNDGVIDATAVPQDKIDQYKSDPRVRQTQGDSTFKLNVNSATQEEWDLHYENVFKKSANKVNYKVKPIMSNDKFLKGLNEAINRKEFADVIGAVPSQDYFGSSYLYDPEGGKGYNESKYHQANLQTRFPDTYGFNYDQAVADFREAVKELVANDFYKYGTENKPTVISIDVWWMGTDDTKLYGKKLEKYIETAFNDPNVCGKKIILDVVNHDGTTNYEDVYNKHLQVGNFDLGFGSISGNALNPLNFLEVLKSDNSSGFTLNWGRPTDEIDPALVYDGKTWSFDTLWTAANSGAVIGQDGKIVKEPIQYNLESIKFNPSDKSYDIVIKWWINDVLAGAGDIVKLKKDASISIFVKVPKNEKEMEYASLIIDNKDITFEGDLIKFNIPYNPDIDGKGQPTVNNPESDKVLKGRFITFQISYDVKIGDISSSNFVEKEFNKANDFQG